MFGYPGRIPRGASLIDNALGARHHDTTPFLKPSPQGMVFYRSYAFLNYQQMRPFKKIFFRIGA